MLTDFTIMHEFHLSDVTSMEGFDFPKAKSLTANVSKAEQEERKRKAAIKIPRCLIRCPHPACGQYQSESSVLAHFIHQHRVGERYQLFELFESKRIAMSALLKTLLHSKKRNIVIANIVYAGPNELPEFRPASRGICLENNFLKPPFNRYQTHLPIFVLGRFTTFAKCLNIPVKSVQKKPNTLILWCATVETTKPLFCYMAVYDSKKTRIGGKLAGVRKLRKSQDPTKFFTKSSNYLQLSMGGPERIDDQLFLSVTILEYEDTSGYDEEKGLEDEDQNDVGINFGNDLNDTNLFESDGEETESPMVAELKKELADISKEQKRSGLEIPDSVPAKQYSTNPVTCAELQDKKKNMSWVKESSETSVSTLIKTPLVFISDDENSNVDQQLNIRLQSVATVPKVNALARSVSSEDSISSKDNLTDTSSMKTLTFEASDVESVYFQQRFINSPSSSAGTVPKMDARAGAVGSKQNISSGGSTFDTCAFKAIIPDITGEESIDSEEASKLNSIQYLEEQSKKFHALAASCTTEMLENVSIPELVSELDDSEEKVEIFSFIHELDNIERLSDESEIEYYDDTEDDADADENAEVVVSAEAHKDN